MDKLYRLRAEVFCRELAWVGSPEDEKEYDNFDNTSTHLGLFIDGQATGYLRVHHHDTPWMINTIFSSPLLGSKPTTQLANSCEVSRLLIKSTHRGKTKVSNHPPLNLLLSHLQNYCRNRNIRYVYMVVTPATRVVFSRIGFKSTPLSKPVKMDDGCYAMAAVLDFGQVETLIPSKKTLCS
ncbi:GNAT family N-acetyltransferase [Shewanella psychropiezotolerans]|uniref:Acyl-homoserine-lactone synthase n=2 Tax=Shewanella TaxID=22 RepID=A0ABX5WWQ7_9GAMM|nr:acyl-homoserine-lactone synthase [Shewanella psychropiezotolerans]QDO82847.1 GNAT family N-acetyltransferase [Shewanella psychropiezotolerans]